MKICGKLVTISRELLLFYLWVIAISILELDG